MTFRAGKTFGSAALVLLPALLLACSPRGNGGSKPPEPAGVASADNAAAHPVEESGVLFRINGDPVETREFRIFLEASFPGEMQEGAQGLGEWTDMFVNNRLLAARAEAEGIDRVGSVKSRLTTRLSHLWRDVYWTEEVKPALRITDKDLLKGAPPVEPMVSIQQLLVGSRELAEELRERAVRGEDFGKIIQEHSVGLTAKGGGLVGFVKEDSKMYDRAFLKSLFAMKDGEFSPVTETTIGFTVVRVLERRTAEQVLREWLETSRADLVREKEKEAWEKALSALVGRHKVVLNEKVIAEFRNAREKNRSLVPLMGKTMVTVDGDPLTVADVTDPSGQGIIHGNQAIEQIVDRRVEDAAIAREAGRLRFREKHPEIALKEKVMRENILARAYIDHRCRDLAVSETEMKEFHRDNPARFTVRKAIDVSLIETKSPQRVREIYAELRKGTPFAEVADRWSDNRKVKGGRLGFVEEERIAPEFSPVKKLKAGEVAAEPIRLRAKDEGVDLYIIPKVEAVREEGVLPFRKADKDSIRKAVIARKREAVIGAVMQELREANKVDFTPEFERFGATLERHTSTQGGTR